MDRWYAGGISQSTWVCENCDEYIPHSQGWQLFAAQCHILPKEHYESVKYHPFNRLHLCAKCHNNFDSSWAKASSMKVFSLAVTRVQTFADQVTEGLPLIFLSTTG